MDQVCDIVKKQLALAEGTEVSGSSKFQELGADSLDTVSELCVLLSLQRLNLSI